jgi:hypothetical protein
MFNMILFKIHVFRFLINQQNKLIFGTFLHFLLSAGFWSCQNYFTFIYSLHKLAWGLFSWAYTSTVKIVQSDTWVFRHPVPSQLNIYGPKVFMLTKLKPEYFDILDNLIISPILRCVGLDRVHCSGAQRINLSLVS